MPKLAALADRITAAVAPLGGDLRVDPLALLGERAAISGMRAGGEVSCGGSTRLIPTGDGWMAVTLARADDVELVPAWLELDGPCDDHWATIDHAASRGSIGSLIERALLVGLPVAALPRADDAVSRQPAVRRVPVAGPTIEPRPLAGLVVADLTSLWAGPLCGALLAAAGATVIKVESTTRPDGARSGPPEFFDLMNGGKRGVALDLHSREGVHALRAIIGASDVVLEASRPRALEQLGIAAAAMVAEGRTRVWASITGHGRTGPERERVAFGDDAAVAGGLAAWDDRGPVFCADAIADPTTGVVAAAAVLEALAGRGRSVLDISMADVAAHLAGPTLPASTTDIASPRARLASARGPRLGEHTDLVLAGLSP